MASDPRYVEFDEMHAVMHYDNKEGPEVVAETRELAERYVAGQWSDEYLSIHSVKVIRHLPEPRALCEFRGRVPYGPQAEPTPEVYDHTEFPGLGNGSIVRLGETTSSVSDFVPFGWSITAWAWDRAQAQAAFEERMTEARQLRDARHEAFSQFPPGCVVRTDTGDTMIRTATRDGVPCWTSASRMIHDANVDPASLTLIAGGVTDGA